MFLLSMNGFLASEHTAQHWFQNFECYCKIYADKLYLRTKRIY